MNTQEIDDIINDYVNGMTLNDVIKKYHHSDKTIRNLLIDNCIHIRNKSEATKGKINLATCSEEEKEDIIQRYLANESIASIARKSVLGQVGVKSILKQNSIPLRDHHEATVIRNQQRRKYFCNEEYFQHQSANMVYILGFIAADGSIGKNSNELKITLAAKDAELLEKIKTELQYTGNLHYATTNSGFDIVSLEITCYQYKKDLAQYNIVPEKTFTFYIPNNIQEEYMIDFIRGYWDGDGTICTAGAAIRSSLCSANRKTLEQILDFLEKKYNIPKVKIQEKQRKSILYYIQYSVNSTKKLYKAFYYDDNVLCLARKHKKFQLLCEDNKNPRDSTSLDEG